MKYNFYVYLFIMAGVTYLIRAIPILSVREKITNRFLNSFLYYLPPTVLSVMTIPGIFYATKSIVSAILGFLAALVFAYLGKDLMKVAALSCGMVLLVEIIQKFI